MRRITWRLTNHPTHSESSECQDNEEHPERGRRNEGPRCSIVYMRRVCLARISFLGKIKHLSQIKGGKAYKTLATGEADLIATECAICFALLPVAVLTGCNTLVHLPSFMWLQRQNPRAVERRAQISRKLTLSGLNKSTWCKGHRHRLDIIRPTPCNLPGTHPQGYYAVHLYRLLFLIALLFWRS